jgi:hypothetical protein
MTKLNALNYPMMFIKIFLEVKYKREGSQQWLATHPFTPKTHLPNFVLYIITSFSILDTQPTASLIRDGWGQNFLGLPTSQDSKRDH